MELQRETAADCFTFSRMNVERKQDAVHVVSGRNAVLRLRERLAAFSECCGQSGAMDDLGYFLGKPGALPRVPHLLLIGAGAADERLQPGGTVGAALVYEQRIGVFGLGAYATNDRSGRSTVLARPEDRTFVAAVAARKLLRNGAHLALMSFRAGDPGAAGVVVEQVMAGGLSTGSRDARWGWRTRVVPEYLPLSATFDETLARVGARTRRNLRYYRRKAESELGATFVPEVRITREELLEFNRYCMYAVPSRVAGWRYDSLKELEQPIFAGMRDGRGRWLSLLGGRRSAGRSEILWQMNRGGFGPYSLGTAMRAYFLEHEIAHGSRRMYTEGGTPHTMRHSFVPETLVDLAVQRTSRVAQAMRAAARRFITPDNELSRMLEATDVEWHPS